MKMRDRVFHDEINAVEKKLKDSYRYGQFLGNIVYFNAVLNKQKVRFDDGTSDCVAPNDTDKVEFFS